MKLNSRKKNNVGRLWISIFFILMFYLLFVFLGDRINTVVIDVKNDINIYFSNKEEILKENNILKKENQELKLKNIFSEYYYNRTKILEEKLNYWENNHIQRNSFKVLSYKEDPIYKALTVENNEHISLKKNDKVYSSKNFVIGKVSSINNNIIRINEFSDLGYKNNFIIIQNGEMLYKGEGVGDSSGLIKISLPRDVKASENSIIVLDDGSQDIVGVFLKDIFKSQDTDREVYFRTIQNPNTMLEVEI